MDYALKIERVSFFYFTWAMCTGLLVTRREPQDGVEVGMRLLCYIVHYFERHVWQLLSVFNP